jgi:hypothetical protein
MRTLTAFHVVSLHILLSRSTRGPVNADALRLLKREAGLVNTSQGAIVDEAAVLDALRHERICGYATASMPLHRRRGLRFKNGGAPNESETVGLRRYIARAVRRREPHALPAGSETPVEK